jgi:hypothetical protein
VLTGINYIYMTASHVSVHIYQGVFHQEDICVISYLVFLPKFVRTFQFVSQLDISKACYVMTYIHLLPLAMTGLHNCDKVLCKAVQGEVKKQLSTSSTEHDQLCMNI